MARQVLLAMLLALCGCARAAQSSQYWGESGELWQPDGPLPDFSFAGYDWGDTEPPAPPATKSLRDFQAPGKPDGEAIADMVAWGNAQPESAGWVVLELPEGQLTLDRDVTLTRSRTVLRGTGRDATELYLPRSLSDMYRNPTGKRFVMKGALITARGPARRAKPLAAVTQLPVLRGESTLEVDSTDDLFAGQSIWVRMRPGNGRLAQEIMDNKLDPGAKYDNTAFYFGSRIAAVDEAVGTVTLERPLPWNLWPELEPELVDYAPGLRDVGVEGFTMRFKHTPYLGHHKARALGGAAELGMSGLELTGVEDSWVSDIRFVNADNCVLVAQSDRVTVRDLDVTVTEPRLGPPEGRMQSQYDGHWGVRVGNSRDVLVSGYTEDAHMVHSLGADAKGAFSVFERARMRIGTVEMHRAQATQCLFTDIHVGDPLHSFYNGGPPSSGPNTGAWTVYWNIRSDQGSHPVPDHSAPNEPGDCSFGPSLAFIGVKFNAPICPDWVHQPEEAFPTNLHQAQLERRQALLADGGTSGTSGTSFATFQMATALGVAACLGLAAWLRRRRRGRPGSRRATLRSYYALERRKGGFL